jgi:hypothetical protein
LFVECEKKYRKDNEEYNTPETRINIAIAKSHRNDAYNLKTELINDMFNIINDFDMQAVVCGWEIDNRNCNSKDFNTFFVLLTNIIHTVIF